METIQPEVNNCISDVTCPNMKFCIERALMLYKGDITSAKMSFISDIAKSDCTRSIKM